MMRISRTLRLLAAATACAVLLSGCGFSVYSLPLPGGADTGKHPYRVTIMFRDVLDLVPQSAVKVDDLTVGKVTEIGLRGWNAEVTVELNHRARLPDNAQAKIRQTSLLGEKFVSLSAPTSGATGRLGDGDVIPLAHTTRSAEVEEVLGALSLLLNGGGLAKVSTITKEVNKALDGREPEIRDLIKHAGSLMSELDGNKQEIVTALKRIDRLARQTKKQKKAITGALDNLPRAVRVLNNQRDDIVKLLKSLDHLSKVGTRTIDKSKANTIHDLERLQPILTELTKAGDALPQSLGLLLTYPFPNALVGTTPTEARDAHLGDYNNLSVRLELSLKQLVNLVQAGGGLLGQQLGGSPLSGGAVDPDALKGLQGLLTGDDGGAGRKRHRQPEPSRPGPEKPVPTTPDRSPVNDAPTLPSLLDPCSLLSLLCRPAPGGAATRENALGADALETDASQILLVPVVAQ